MYLCTLDIVLMFEFDLDVKHLSVRLGIKIDPFAVAANGATLAYAIMYPLRHPSRLPCVYTVIV